MRGGVTGRGFDTRSARRRKALARQGGLARAARRHPDTAGRASVRAKILARMVALGKASRA